MMRKRLKLAYIANASLRKSTFTKRKKGFMKKIEELSVRCGIEACAIIYNPLSSTLDVWPTHARVKNVVDKFEMLPEIEQEKKMVNHEDFLLQSIVKTKKNYNKKMAENDERTMKEVMFQLLRGNRDKLNLTDGNRHDFYKYIDQYLKELIHQRNNFLSQSHLQYGDSSSAVNVMEPRTITEVGSFQVLDVFNPPQLTNDLNSFISPNQRPEQVNTFTDNILHAANDQQGYYPMMNSIGFYDQNLHNSNNQFPQRFGYSNVGHDGTHNQKQNQIQQDERLVDQMMNHHEEMCFL